ncbi:serine/threonine-protein kinase [Actinomycetospora termitidis]|uniref:non-specific serine/threonine protein kinase n=1 Tax=Actinomycetospora termitidis TaxID=3053470 RepID=A0ABT7ME12_9PSEU|nr:serine/threonine-protein kinase [Actinomycetospora sp. Odt1-22]MDL5158902.1 serine/threonine-protein kinase [Actinomycetospora sp. Odt1-22]
MVGGEEFGPYRLQRLLGRGGMGEVFAAYDVGQDREVAVKRLLAHMADDPDFQKRFKRESRAAARLRNPHVVPIHTYGEIDGRLFLDMRLVNGCDLERLLVEEGRLRASRAVAIVSQVASALDAAHRDGLVHRDVKPSNILLDRDFSDEDFVYLADFGITRASSGSSAALTASHVVVGSLQYMAPEQFDGVAGPEADIYSLGCVFYQCLTGALPFEVDGFPSLMKAHTEAAPPVPSLRCREVPSGFDDVIARAMAKDPADRYTSAAEFAKDARVVLDRSSAGHSARDGAAVPPASTRILTDPPTPVSDAEAGDPASAATVVTDRRPPTDDADRTAVVATPSGPTGPGGPGGPGGGRNQGKSRRGMVAALAVVLVAAVVAALVVIVGNSDTDTDTAAASSEATATGAPRPPAEEEKPIAVSRPDASLVGTFPTNGEPETVAVSPDGKSAYLTITGDRPALEVLDIASGQVLQDVPVPGPPYFVGVSPSGEHAYVTYYDKTQQQLVIGTMDTRLNEFDGAIPTGQRADQGSALTWLFGFAIAPKEPHLLYVPNMNASTVSVLDPESRAPVAEIPTPASPHWVALTPDGRYGYVTNHVPGQITIIDTTTNAVVGSVPIGPGVAPHSIAVSPDGKLVEEVNYDGDSVTFIDAASNTVIGTTPLPEGPQSIAFAPDGAHSYVVNEDGKSMSIIDNRTRQVTQNVPAGDDASMVALTPDGSRAVVANKESKNVMIYDVGTLPPH